MPAEVGLGLPAEVGLGLPAEVSLGLPAECGLGLPAEVGIGLPEQGWHDPLSAQVGLITVLVVAFVISSVELAFSIHFICKVNLNIAAVFGKRFVIAVTRVAWLIGPDIS